MGMEPKALVISKKTEQPGFKKSKIRVPLVNKLERIADSVLNPVELGVV